MGCPHPKDVFILLTLAIKIFVLTIGLMAFFFFICSKFIVIFGNHFILQSFYNWFNLGIRSIRISVFHARCRLGILLFLGIAIALFYILINFGVGCFRIIASCTECRLKSYLFDLIDTVVQFQLLGLIFWLCNGVFVI